jgi:ribosome-associated protein
MKTQTFTLKEDNDFIALDTLMKLMRLANSGGEAHTFIKEGGVLVNDAVVLEKRKKIRSGDKVAFNGQSIEIKA